MDAKTSVGLVISAKEKRSGVPAVSLVLDAFNIVFLASDDESVERATGLLLPPEATAIAEVSPRHSPSRGVINDDSQYLGPTAGETFISRSWRRIRRDHYMTRFSPSHTGTLSPEADSNNRHVESSAHPAVVLPQITHQQATDLVRFYFDVAVVSYRFLNSKSVLGWVDDLFAGDSAISESYRQTLGPYKASILFMLFATSLHYQEISGEAVISGSRMSKAFLTAGRQSLKMQKHYHRLETVQARLAHSIYLLATSKLEASWYVLGRTVQIMTALGMHRKGHEHPSSFRTEIQSIRRCFWTAYTLDRYVSIILGRPRLIFDDLFDQPFPERIDDDYPELTFSDWAATPNFGLDCRIESAADCSLDGPYFTHRLAQIMGEISFDIYPLKGIAREPQAENSARLTAKLMDFWRGLPPSLGEVHPDSLSPSLRRRTIELRISCNHAIVLANRPFLLGKSDADDQGLDDVTHSHDDKVERAVRAACTVVNLWDKGTEEGSVFGAFWIIHHAVFSAVSVLYLYIIFNSRRGTRAAQRLSESEEEVFLFAQRGQQHLAAAASVNRMCVRYSSILEELRQEAMKQISTSALAVPFLVVGDSQPLEASSPGNTNRIGTGLGTDVPDITSDEQFRSTMYAAGDGELIGDWSIFDSLISFDPDVMAIQPNDPTHLLGPEARPDTK
ncbi:hypothetical protein AYO22_01916 [Fonsecaea multimorphosa]|nr:hypothetical protein AYO22_01916 [Fonsecaea multimorphosa]